MSPTATSPAGTAHYDPVTIRLHWGIVALVAMQWLGAELIDYVPGRDLHRLYWSIHITIGLIFAATVAAHVWWRGRHGRQLPHSNEEGWRLASRAMHAILTFIPALLVFLGFSIILARGWNLYGVLSIPALPGGSRHLARTLTEIHEWTAHVLVVLALGHSAAALFHHYRLSDGVLKRMIPSLSGSARRTDPGLG